VSYLRDIFWAVIYVSTKIENLTRKARETRRVLSISVFMSCALLYGTIENSSEIHPEIFVLCAIASLHLCVIVFQFNARAQRCRDAKSVVNRGLHVFCVVVHSTDKTKRTAGDSPGFARSVGLRLSGLALIIRGSPRRWLQACQWLNSQNGQYQVQ